MSVLFALAGAVISVFFSSTHRNRNNKNNLLVVQNLIYMHFTDNSKTLKGHVTRSNFSCNLQEKIHV